jgi:hypothetical protein
MIDTLATLIGFSIYISFFIILLATDGNNQTAYSVIIKLGSQRIIVYSSMNRDQADAVREAIAQSVQARTLTGHPQPSTTG